MSLPPAEQSTSPEPARAPGEPAVRRSNTAVHVALFLVAVLAGSALFVSGFTLGRQNALTAGTGPSLQEEFAPFWDAYGKITSEYVGDFDRKKLVEGAIGGLFQALGDPYSVYLTSDQYRQSLAQLSGEFEGIGAEMATRDEAGEAGCSPLGPKCWAVVVRTFRDAPARKAGLQPDDRVVAIDGQSVDGLTLEDTVGRVKGKRGTEVTLTIERGAGAPFDVRIRRDVVRIEDVESRLLAGGRVGYLRIVGFSANAAEDFRLQLAAMVGEQRVRRIVLDLRDDPGGFVDQARDIASQFIGSGPIFSYEYSGGRRVPQEAAPGGAATDPAIDLVVLVNGGTASASEIVAGAIQDTGRGRLVGEKTFGKGTVQQFIELDDYGGFRLSVARWLTPSGRWIHGTGLEPDVVVAVPDDVAEGEDRQLDRAVELLTAGGADTGLRVRLAPEPLTA